MSKSPARVYTEEDKERGHQALAFCQGNREAAAKMLEDAGHPIPASTLRDWRRRDPERYERARLAIQERVWAEVGDEWLALTRKNVRVASKLVDKAEELTDSGDINEAAKAARAAQSLSVSGGIGTDKVGVSQKRDPLPPEARSLPELLKALRSPKFGGVVTINPNFLEGVGVEVPDEPVVPELEGGGGDK